MMWNKFSILFFLLFLVQNARSQQPDTAFIHHLVRFNLELEHEQYLFKKLQYSPENTLLSQYRLRFLLHTEKDSLFLSEYRLSADVADSVLFRYATVYFLNPLRLGHKTWFEELNSENADLQRSAEFSMFQKAWYARDTTMTDIPFALHESYENYLKYRDKKAWKAGLYSAIIPGSGKLYAGHKRSFLPNFIMHAAMGAQTAEAISKNGIKSAISIVNLSVFAFYYASNIYGSARAVKTKQKEFRNQFLIEASEYYDSKCNCDLY